MMLAAIMSDIVDEPACGTNTAHLNYNFSHHPARKLIELVYNIHKAVR